MLVEKAGNTFITVPVDEHRDFTKMTLFEFIAGQVPDDVPVN